MLAHVSDYAHQRGTLAVDDQNRSRRICRNGIGGT